MFSRVCRAKLARDSIFSTVGLGLQQWRPIGDEISQILSVGCALQLLCVGIYLLYVNPLIA